MVSPLRFVIYSPPVSLDYALVSVFEMSVLSWTIVISYQSRSAHNRNRQRKTKSWIRVGALLLGGSLSLCLGIFTVTLSPSEFAFSVLPRRSSWINCLRPAIYFWFLSAPSVYNVYLIRIFNLLVLTFFFWRWNTYSYLSVCFGVKCCAFLPDFWYFFVTLLRCETEIYN